MCVLDLGVLLAMRLHQVRINLSTSACCGQVFPPIPHLYFSWCSIWHTSFRCKYLLHSYAFMFITFIHLCSLFVLRCLFTFTVAVFFVYSHF